MIVIKFIKHFSFCLKYKASTSTVTVYDFILLSILLIFALVSFNCKNIYSILAEYSFILPIVALSVYLFVMLMSFFQKLPKNEYMLFKFLCFSKTDLLFISYIKTFFTNILMSIVFANFSAYWNINFFPALISTFILGNIIVFLIYNFIITNFKKNTKSTQKLHSINNLFFKNKYTSFFYKTFFGYSKSSYEYFDMLSCIALVMVVFSLHIFLGLNFIISAYLSVCFLTPIVIDIYAIEHKNQRLSHILNISAKQSFKMSFFIISLLTYITTFLFFIISSFISGFNLIHLISVIFFSLYFMPIQYSLLIIAQKKLSIGIPIMSAFIINILVSIIPFVNNIYAIGIILNKYYKEHSQYVKNR